jgi:hypothetical protein
VRLENDPQFAAAYPRRQGAEVVITLKNGERRSARLPELIPLDAIGVHSRFMASVDRLFGAARARELDAEIDNLLDQPDAARVARLLAA